MLKVRLYSEIFLFFFFFSHNHGPTKVDKHSVRGIHPEFQEDADFMLESGAKPALTQTFLEKKGLKVSTTALSNRKSYLQQQVKQLEKINCNLTCFLIRKTLAKIHHWLTFNPTMDFPVELHFSVFFKKIPRL